MSKPFADFSKYPSLRSASTQPLGILLTEYIGKHFALRVSLRIHSAKVDPCLASKIEHQLHPLTVWVGRAQSCLRGLATGSRFTACTAKQPSALPSARHVASVNVCSVKSLVALGKLCGVRQRCSQWQAELLGDPQPSPCHPRPSQLHLTAGARLCLWQTPCLSITPWGRTNPCRSRWHRRPNPQRRRVTAPRRSCHLNLARSSTLLAQRSETSTIP